MLATSGVFMRAILTAFAAFLVMMISWPWLVLDPAQRIPTTGLGLTWDAILNVENPKQTIRTAETVYDLEAERLRVLKQGSLEVLLTRPKMMITWQDGSWLTVTARAGLFNKKSKALQLIADVKIQDARGTDLSTESAVIRMTQQTAEGFSAITGKMGQNVHVIAAGFRLKEGAAQYEFLGETEMLISSS